MENNTAPNDFWRGPGFGMGHGRGWGCQGNQGGGRHGWRHQFNATGVPGWMRTSLGATQTPPLAEASPLPESAREQTLTALRQQAGALEQALGDLRAKLHELENAEAKTAILNAKVRP